MTIGNDGGNLRSLGEVNDAQWAALAQRPVFFGHQSVGGNIMAGVADVLADQPKIRLRVTESRDIIGGQPAFQHTRVGRNEHPLEKFDDFVALASRLGQSGGLALMKLCYVDFHKDTDAAALFEEYRRRVEAMRARHPAVVVVHVTTPLTDIENWKGRLRAAVSGYVTQRDRNVVRNRYNESMRRAYRGMEPLFDLAELESTLPDGRRASFRAGGEDVPLLASDYTDDGGHLNTRSRRMVAEQLLIRLAQWSSPSS